MNPEKKQRMEQAQERHRQNVQGLQFKEWPKIGRLNRDIVITEKIDGTNGAIGIQRLDPLPRKIDDTEYYVLSDDSVQVDGEWFRVYAQSRSRIITPDNDNYGFARWVWQHREVLVRTLGEGIHFGEWWGLGINRGYDLTERRFSLFNTMKWNDGPGAEALALARAQGVAIYSVPVLYTGPWTGMFGFYDTTADDDVAPAWLTREQMVGWNDELAVFDARDQRVDDVIERLMLDPAVDRNRVREILRTLIDVNPRARFAPNFIMQWLKRVGSFAADGFMRPEGIVVYHRAGDVCLKATVENDESRKGV